jgi:hypothetical protein
MEIAGLEEAHATPATEVAQQVELPSREVRAVPSVDTSNPATDRHRKTGHHAGELRLVIGMR